MSIKLKDTIYDLINRAEKDGAGNTITSTYLNKTTGGTITGDLALNAGNEDRFLKFQYNNGDTYGWRIGYLGSGSGDANYLVIQTSQGTEATWTNSLRLGNTKGDALFSATVTADGGFIGALTGNVTGNVSGSSGSCTGNAASATKLSTARTLWGQNFNGTANVSGNMTGVGSISMSSTLTLTGTTSANARINFSRGSSSDYPYNYITAPTGGIICMEPGGLDCSSATGYHFSNTAFYPAANNTYSLGTSSLKWSNVYATTFTGSLSGNATSSSSCSGNSATATLASTVTCPATSSNYDRPIVGTPGNNTLYHTTLATVNWSTGKIICGGLQSKDITLYSASGDSPHLIFQRGGLYDGTYDWDIFVTGGTLKFRVNKSSATAASYTDILKMYNDDDTIRSTWPIYASTFKNSSGTEVSYSGHTHSAYYDSTISRTANTVLAAPNGSAGTASFRALVAADIPNISAAKITSGTLAVARGGTGKTTLADACNAFINSLSTGTSTPVDTDYYVAQYVGGGTTTTTYHRRPVSALYTYMKGKFDSVYAPTHSHPYAASDHGHSNYFISARGTYSAYTSVPGNASGAYMISTAGWYGSMTVFYAAGSNSALGFYRPGGSNSCPQICVALDSTSNWSNLGTILTSGNWSSYISIPSGGSSFDGTWTGTLMVNGSNSRGNYPSVRWHIPNVNWAQFIMNGSGELELRGGGSQDAGYSTLRTGWCCCTGLQINGEAITFTT